MPRRTGCWPWTPTRARNDGSSRRTVPSPRPRPSRTIPCSSRRKQGRPFRSAPTASSDGAVQTFTLDGDVRWTASLIGTPVSASPTIAGDRVYAATNDANGTVYAWRLPDVGSGEWALQLAPPDYLLSSPVVHDGALYIASDNGRRYRLADVPASTSSGIGVVALIIGGGLAV